jgi:hypothetical protein
MEDEGSPIPHHPENQPKRFCHRPVERQSKAIRPVAGGPDRPQTRDAVELWDLDDERQIVEHKARAQRVEIRQDRNE